MKLRNHCQPNILRPDGKSGFTLIETLVASTLGGLVLTGSLAFIYFSAVSVSGITAQSLINQQAGNTIEFIQSRFRFATSFSNDVAGNALTLGFDDNYSVDSDTNGITYNDQDHYERFQFIGVNSTNTTACATNQLVYFPNITSTSNRTLISSGVRNLPGYNIFTLTNKSFAIIRFGIVDKYSGDHYQAADIQGTAVSLNRPFTNNVIAIFP
jgi:prepilin-type N-terminal cleavage/methylation domain-containing protein